MTLIEFIPYARKFLVALAAALAVLTTALVDGAVSVSEWVTVALAFISALGVYYTPNKEIKK